MVSIQKHKVGQKELRNSLAFRMQSSAFSLLSIKMRDFRPKSKKKKKKVNNTKY